MAMLDNAYLHDFGGGHTIIWKEDDFEKLVDLFVIVDSLRNS